MEGHLSVTYWFPYMLWLVEMVALLVIWYGFLHCVALSRQSAGVSWFHIGVRRSDGQTCFY